MEIALDGNRPESPLALAHLFHRVALGSSPVARIGVNLNTMTVTSFDIGSQMIRTSFVPRTGYLYVLEQVFYQGWKYT